MNASILREGPLAEVERYLLSLVSAQKTLLKTFEMVVGVQPCGLSAMIVSCSLLAGYVYKFGP